jgi:hypothetical protein
VSGNRHDVNPQTAIVATNNQLSRQSAIHNRVNRQSTIRNRVNPQSEIRNQQFAAAESS